MITQWPGTRKARRVHRQRTDRISAPGGRKTKTGLEKAEEADTMKKRNSSVFGQSCAGMTDAEEDSIQDIFAAAGTIGGQFASSSRGCMTLFELRGEYI